MLVRGPLKWSAQKEDQAVTRWPVSDSQVGNVCYHWHSCASDQVSRELVAVQVRGSA